MECQYRLPWFFLFWTAILGGHHTNSTIHLHVQKWTRLQNRCPKCPPKTWELQNCKSLGDFYRAACNADAVLWWDFCPSVCLSVRPSVTRVNCDKTEVRSVQIFIPYERTFSLVFWEEEWLVGGDPFYLKFWVNRPPLERNRQFSTNNRS